MNKGSRRLLIGTGLVMGLFFMGMAVVVGFAQSDRAREMAIEAVNRRIPGRVFWHSHRISPVRGKVTLTDLQLKDPDGVTLVHVDRLALAWSWRGIFLKQVVIQRLDVHNPRLRLDRKPDGRLNLISALSPDRRPEKTPQEPAPHLSIRALGVSGGRIQYSDQLRKTDVTLTGIDIKASADLPVPTATFEAAVQKVQFTSPDAAVDLTPLVLKGQWVQNRIRDLSIHARRGHTNLHLSGEIDHLFTMPTLELAVKASLDLGELKTVAASVPEISGRTDMRIQVRGTLDDPLVDVALEYGGGHLMGRKIRGLAARVTMSHHQVSISDMSLELPGGRFSLIGLLDLGPALPGGRLGTALDMDAVVYDLTLTLEKGRLDALPALRDHLQGTLQSHLTLKGSGISPDRLSCNAKLNLTGMVKPASPAPDSPDEPIDLQATAEIGLANGRLHLDRLAMTADAVTLNAQGEGTLSGDQLQGRLSFSTPHLSGASALVHKAGLGNPHLSGEARVDVRISGSLQHPQVMVDVDGNDLGLNTAGPNQDAINADMDHRRGWSLAGLKVNAELAGTFDQPTVKARITGEGMRLPGMRPLDLETTLSLDRGILRADPLSVQFGPSTVTVEGQATIMETPGNRWMADPVLAVSLEGRGVQLADIAEDLKGTVDIAARVNGTLSAPLGSFQIQGRRIGLEQQKVPLVNLAGDLAPGKLTVTALQIHTAPQEIISAHGWYAFNRTFSFHMASDPESAGIHLDRISFWREKTALNGRAAFTITGRGSIEAPKLSGSLSLTELSRLELPLPDIHCDWTLEDEQLQGTVRQAGTTVAGRYHLADGVFSADLELTDVPLKTYFLMANQPQLSGSASGTLRLQGTVHDLERVSLAGKLTALSLFFKQQELVQTDGFEISYQNGAFSIPAFDCRLMQSGALSIRGNGRLKGPIRLDVQGDIPMQATTPFLNAVAGSSGRIKLTAQVAGTMAAPALTATLDLVDAAFPVTYLDRSLTGINGRIKLTPQAVSIEGLEGRLDTGRFSLSGKVGLDRMHPSVMDVHLHAAMLPIHIPDTGDVRLDADLSLEGPWKASTLGGTLVLLEGTYTRDMNLNLLEGLSRIAQKKRAPTPPKDPADSLLANLTLNIDIRRRQLLRVENDLADLEVDPELKLTGNLARPILTGRARVASGFVRLEQRKFTIKRGLITFLNPYRTEAGIDILGSTDIRTWEITLSISGTTEALNVGLTADPPLAQDEIISLLVLGKTATELIRGEGGQARSGTQVMADLAASAFGRDARKAAGLDMLELETGPEGQTKSTAKTTKDAPTDRVKVTIGKKLSRRLTVLYSVESKDGALTQRADAEYRLRERLLVGGFQDSEGVYGGKLLFRLEFR